VSETSVYTEMVKTFRILYSQVLYRVHNSPSLFSILIHFNSLHKFSYHPFGRYLVLFCYPLVDNTRNIFVLQSDAIILRINVQIKSKQFETQSHLTLNWEHVETLIWKYL